MKKLTAEDGQRTCSERDVLAWYRRRAAGGGTARGSGPGHRGQDRESWCLGQYRVYCCVLGIVLSYVSLVVSVFGVIVMLAVCMLLDPSYKTRNLSVKTEDQH